MVRIFFLGLVFVTAGWGLIAPARHFVLTAASAQDDTPENSGLPAGPGREKVFYLCQACHSLRTVLQQRLPRWEWGYTLDWMVEEQGMSELEPEEREVILNYLGTYLSATSPR